MSLPLLLLLAAVADPGAGRFQGTVAVPGRTLNLTVDLVPGPAGAWKGSALFSGLGLGASPLAEIVVTPAAVHFVVAPGPRGFGASFQGRLSGATLAGVMSHSGHEAPFTLQRTGEPQVEEPLASTPVSAAAVGEWRGDYEMLGYARHVTLVLKNQAEGPATASFVIVGKRHNDLPVSLLRQQGDYLTVESQTTGLTLEGRIAGEEWTGTLIQGSLEVPLVLRRTAGGAR